MKTHGAAARVLNEKTAQQFDAEHAWRAAFGATAHQTHFAVSCRPQRANPDAIHWDDAAALCPGRMQGAQGA
jgi:hypothetical protein